MAPSQPTPSTSTLPPSLSAASSLLTKFILHPASVCGSTSAVATWLVSHPTPSVSELEQLRATLQTAREGASQRLPIKDANKAILVARQVRDKQLVEEQARLKDAERRRKREEDEERRERERQEREEQDRVRREVEDVPAVEEPEESEVEMEDVKMEIVQEDDQSALAHSKSQGARETDSLGRLNAHGIIWCSSSHHDPVVARGGGGWGR